MADYSEFEEEDEVDLHNLIGSKSDRPSASQHSVKGLGASSFKPSPASPASSSGYGATASAATRAARDDADFDVDF